MYLYIHWPMVYSQSCIVVLSCFALLSRFVLPLNVVEGRRASGERHPLPLTLGELQIVPSHPPNPKTPTSPTHQLSSESFNLVRHFFFCVRLSFPPEACVSSSEAGSVSQSRAKTRIRPSIYRNDKSVNTCLLFNMTCCYDCSLRSLCGATLCHLQRVTNTSTCLLSLSLLDRPTAPSPLSPPACSSGWLST